MVKPTEDQLKNIKPEYRKKILIHQDINERGKSTFNILHKQSYFHQYTAAGIPPEYRSRKTFDAAEKVALYLLLNYEKYFLG